MQPRMIGEEVFRGVRQKSLQKIIQETMVYCGGGILFEELLGLLPRKYGKNYFENPDTVESVIVSMPNLKMIKYRNSNGIKRFVYIPVKD